MDQQFDLQQSFLRVAAAAAIAGAGYIGSVVLPTAPVHAEPSGSGSDSSASSSSGGTSEKHHVSGSAGSDPASRTRKNSPTHTKAGEAGTGGAVSGSSSSRDRASGGPGSPGLSKDGNDRLVGAKVGAASAARSEDSSGAAGVGVEASGKAPIHVGVLGSPVTAAVVQPNERTGLGLVASPKSLSRGTPTFEQRAAQAQTASVDMGHNIVSLAVVAAADGINRTENLHGRSGRRAATDVDSAEPKIKTKTLDSGEAAFKAPTVSAVNNPAVGKTAATKDEAKPVVVSASSATAVQPPVVASTMMSAPTTTVVEASTPVVPLRPNPVQPSAPLPAPLTPPSPAGVFMATASAASGTRKRAESSGDSVVQPEKRKVVVIALDGTNLDKVLEANTPNIDRLMQEGTTGPSNLRGHMSLSNPSWTAQLTGAWDDKTGVSSNTFTPETYEKFPSLFTHIESARPELKTSSISNWKVIKDISESGVKHADDVAYFSDDDPTYAASGARVADETVKRIASGESDFILSYDQQVDVAGHNYGADSPEYIRAIERADLNIGKIMDAIREREAATGEKWDVILTTDHGHTPEGGHGNQSPDETSTFTIIRGEGFGPGEVNMQFSNADTTPTILKRLGVPLSPNFDGVDLRTLSEHALKPADLETAIRDIVKTNHDPDLLTALRLDARYALNGVVTLVDEFIFRGDFTLLDEAARTRIPVISQVAPFVASVLRFIKPVLTGATNLLDGGISQAIQLASKAATGVVNLLNYSIGGAMQLAKTVAGANIPIISPAAAFVVATLKKFSAVVTGVTNLFNDGVTGAMQLIADANIPIISPIAAFVTATFQTILKAVGTVSSGAKDFRSALVRTLRETIGWLTGVQPNPPSTAPVPQQNPTNQSPAPQPEPSAA